jgi:hypothetical protein
MVFTQVEAQQGAWQRYRDPQYFPARAQAYCLFAQVIHRLVHRKVLSRCRCHTVPARPRGRTTSPRLLVSRTLPSFAASAATGSAGTAPIRRQRCTGMRRVA